MKIAKNATRLGLAGSLTCIAVVGLIGQSNGGKPVYLDSAAPVERRVEDLLGRMTLKEKLGQLNMPCVYVDELGKDMESKRVACRKFAEGTYTEEIGPGGGFFTLADNTLPEGSRQQALYFNELQKIAIEKTRLKIPLLQTEEGTHGVMCSGKTIFPEGPGHRQHLEHGPGAPDLYRGGKGSPGRRHPSTVHAGGGAEPRSPSRQKPGRLQRRSLPVFADCGIAGARRAG